MGAAVASLKSTLQGRRGIGLTDSPDYQFLYNLADIGECGNFPVV